MVLPAARGGVITGLLLAVARCMGEAAPVLFTAGQTQWWNVNAFHGSVPSLPVQIYVYAISPDDDWHSLAWASAFVLVALVFVLSLAARYATRGRVKLVR